MNWPVIFACLTNLALWVAAYFAMQFILTAHLITAGWAIIIIFIIGVSVGLAIRGTQPPKGA
jgi:hypothetical protein